MNFVTWVLFGSILGIITYEFSRDTERKNLWLSMVIGIGGALVGGLLSRLMFGIGITGFNIISFLLAVYSSIIIVFIGKSIIKL